MSRENVVSLQVQTRLPSCSNSNETQMERARALVGSGGEDAGRWLDAELLRVGLWVKVTVVVSSGSGGGGGEGGEDG